jgi:hypothetical protein
VALTWNRDRDVPTPVSSYTWVVISSPFTVTGPSGLTWTNPSASFRVSPVMSTDPGLAICSIRAARCVVCPTAV